MYKVGALLTLREIVNEHIYSGGFFDNHTGSFFGQFDKAIVAFRCNLVSMWQFQYGRPRIADNQLETLL